MKYLGAIIDDNDIATKKYVDDHAGGGVQSVEVVAQYPSTGTLIADIDVDGLTESLYAPTPPTLTSQLTNDSGFINSASAVYSAGVKIATVGNVDIYVPVYGGGVS